VRCASEEPKLREIDGGHAACHHAVAMAEMPMAAGEREGRNGCAV